MDQLFDELRRFNALHDSPDGQYHDKVHIETVSGKEPSYATASAMEKLQESVSVALQAMNIPQLYEHQVDAIERIRSGEDVVIASPTASGKTLCYNIPIVLELQKHLSARSLMVYSMKALANDQRLQLDSLCQAIGKPQPESWLYDGDTPQDQRRLIRNNPPQILLTNPEMLHLSFLAHWEKWENYLRDLRFLVIDEIHEYRGYFGTNVAILFRRFLRKLNELGSKCQLVLASATCANPEEHAHRLTGRKPKLVLCNKGMRPTRTFVFINPDLPSFDYYRIYLVRIASAALACLSKDLSVIVFCPTRRFAEDVSVQLEWHKYKLEIA